MLDTGTSDGPANACLAQGRRVRARIEAYTSSDYCRRRDEGLGRRRVRGGGAPTHAQYLALGGFILNTEDCMPCCNAMQFNAMVGGWTPAGSLPLPLPFALASRQERSVFIPSKRLVQSLLLANDLRTLDRCWCVAQILCLLCASCCALKLQHRSEPVRSKKSYHFMLVVWPACLPACLSVGECVLCFSDWLSGCWLAGDY